MSTTTDDGTGFVLAAFSALRTYRQGDIRAANRALTSIPESDRAPALLVVADLAFAGLAKALGQPWDAVVDYITTDLIAQAEEDDR